MNALRLLRRYMSASVKAQMQYPGSMAMIVAGQFVTTMLDLVAIWALFSRFGSVDGWRFGDIAMFFGLVSISFAIADFLTRGFDVLGTEFIKTGNFDRILLRPEPTLDGWAAAFRQSSASSQVSPTSRWPKLSCGSLATRR